MLGYHRYLCLALLCYDPLRMRRVHKEETVLLPEASLIFHSENEKPKVTFSDREPQLAIQCSKFHSDTFIHIGINSVFAASRIP